MRQRLKVAFYDCVHKNARVFFCVPRRHIHHVRFHNHRAGAGGISAAGGMKRSNGSVVREAVVSADDAKAEDVLFFVEDLESLGAPAGGEAGDDVDLTDCSYGAVAADDVAALHEVLVGLGVVKAADDGPYGRNRRGNLLHHR
ncbi:uncharacterized protein DS421_2g55020 [Arachis hypogaea]|nr:uncharacterized protein DS421_2g55020 [Arachis hypogaea]